LAFAGFLVRWVMSKDTGSEKMRAISDAIREGVPETPEPHHSVFGGVVRGNSFRGLRLHSNAPGV
jgi:hypothetical protein